MQDCKFNTCNYYKGYTLDVLKANCRQVRKGEKTSRRAVGSKLVFLVMTQWKRAQGCILVTAVSVEMHRALWLHIKLCTSNE